MLYLSLFVRIGVGYFLLRIWTRGGQLWAFEHVNTRGLQHMGTLTANPWDGKVKKVGGVGNKHRSFNISNYYVFTETGVSIRKEENYFNLEYSYYDIAGSDLCKRVRVMQDIVDKLGVYILSRRDVIVFR